MGASDAKILRKQLISDHRIGMGIVYHLVYSGSINTQPNPQVKRKIKKWYETRGYQAGMMTHDDFTKLLHDIQKTPEVRDFWLLSSSFCPALFITNKPAPFITYPHFRPCWRCDSNHRTRTTAACFSRR